MTNPGSSLPSHVLEEMRGGNKIEAIKRLRQSTGLGLRAAKDLIEAHARNDPTVVSTRDSLASALPAPVVDAIQRGSLVEAMRLLRAHGGPGLKQAKALVESARPTMMQSSQPPTDTFNRVVSALWWVLALMLGGFAAHHFLRNSG